MEPTPSADRSRVLSALVLVQIFFGVHYLMAKVLLETIPPLVWAPIRVAGAAVLLAAAAVVLRRPFPSRKGDLAKLALFSIFGVIVNQICFVEGLHRTTPTHSALINTWIPVGTLLFAVLLGREAMTWRKGVSLLLALGGVLLVIRPDRPSTGGATLAGDLLTLVNGTSYAFFLVISKRILSRTDPLAATAVLLVFGTLGIGLVGSPSLMAFDPSTVPASIWGLGVLIVLFPTAGAYFLIYWALARAESSLVALFIYLQPLLAGVLSAILLGERPAATTYAGAALLFAGVWLATRPGQGRGGGRSASRASSSTPTPSASSSMSNLGE
jgi:drug/metabolite transporter (DMT)-like permease